MYAIFLCLAAHYVFNIEYHPKAKDVWEFIQENVLDISSKGNKKRNATSSTHFSGIKRMHSSFADAADFEELQDM